ncbi:MAG: AMP-binding protein [Burkholderiaceae bacterium]
MNLAAAFEATVAADPDRVAIHAEGRALTRRALRDAIVGKARMLRDELEVGLGDRVGYLGLNRSEELVLLFALARIGAVFVPMNTRLAVGELVHIADHARLRVLLTDASHRAIGEAMCAAMADDAMVLQAIDEPVRFDDGAPVDDVAIAPSSPLLLVYTSGTTGAAKGAVHTHAGMIANAAAAIAAHRMTADDRVLSVLPLFHVGGLCIQTVPALLAGASVILHPRFDAQAWLAAIATMRPTLTLMVPATLRAAMADPGWAAADLSCLRVLMTGSSVIPRHLIEAVHARGVPVGQIYGSTETGPVTVALTSDDARRKPGRAGWPCFDGSLRLIDADGIDVALGAVGEIAVRAPNLMRGYWGEDDLRGGWFLTGDLGRFDDDGCLEIVGRLRDLIISGGENVYPAEVEDVLLAIPGIAEAAVIGIPDERWGEVPAAFIVRRDDVDEATVRGAFVDRIARYKHPKRIVFVDSLPRNAMGKVQADVLRARVMGAEA